ncbi:ubiquitin carboxyl-terminal hydrolase 5 [Sitodiplosis mosellana]|uniref:ubiquitin carboxyl-terminal hydrolase 5 n=1 Tax=Sitodiplosis mosellana TaxID=263140 RepID=UPI0024439600|nr:ubiquitin carboxyl-terminal hydrolase 5 [Sitodiplosis mosellana]
MEVLSAHLKNIRVPCGNDNVFKDECVYSYDTPETPTGLYVSLSTFLGFGQDYVDGYYQKSGNAVFLHIFREKIEIPATNEPQTDGPEKKITRLAIGVEGGFDPSENKRKYEYKDHLNVVVFPNAVKIPYPNIDLPLLVSNAVEAILAAESITTKLEKDALTGTWDGEKRQVSQYATNLQQLDNGKKIPPSGWKCEKCDLTNNLWLNLTDGSILCGRRFFDGSGGNDHAIQHYSECGYPLAVKLGTITPDGKGDVFSYSEDDMVENPNLIEHLAHFGIKTNQLEKTDKSMIELELDLNQRIGEWSILTESSSNLEPISGPGYTGMKNLGNSCYMNSVMQTLFTIPDFVERFVTKAPQIFDRYPSNPANDFDIQFAKLGVGLWSGKYSGVADNTLDSDSTGISPVMFKNLIGKNHKEFSSKQQQDAQEFLLHVISELEKHSRNESNPADALKFSVEDRVECCASGKVKYTKRDEYCLPLHIPLQLATNAAEVREYDQKVAEAESRGQKIDPNLHVRPRIPLQYCLDRFGQTEVVEQFYSTAINGQTNAKKTTRLATMPDYIILHLKKFTLREDWTCVKLDVAVEIPDILDLSALRSTGLQSNEELLPELDKEPPQPEFDEGFMGQLTEMGFPIEACKRALFYTKNAEIELATQWLMEHISDSDFGDPFVPPGTDVSGVAFVPDPSGLEMLMGMGFNKVQATKALKETNNNIERAADWIFSHQMEIDNLEEGAAVEASSNAPPAPQQYRDGDGQYKLVGFISHMGSSSQVGHYVCHILKNDKWVIFNDSKVAISQNPPKELGYLYLYQRL